MNFPTARLHAFHGRPIARSSWGGNAAPEGDTGGTDPSRWLTFEGGAWFVTESESRTIVKSARTGEEATITVADLLADDWQIPSGCHAAAVVQAPPFPVTDSQKNADAPLFDVRNPPCVLLR